MRLSPLTRTFLAVAFAVAGIWPVSTQAAGPLSIEQISSNEILGTWTVTGPSDWTDRGDGASKTYDNLAAGTYTILIRQPTGSTVRVQLLKNGEVVQTATVGQMTFTLGDEATKILAFYSFSLVGTVGAASDPSGLNFSVTGPNGYYEEATTPWSWTQAPAGQYSLTFKAPEGCSPPKTMGQRLQAGERISFSITLDCDAADKLREGLKNVDTQRAKQRNEEAAANLSSSVFSDVSRDSWYAPYVWRVSQRSLLAGYKNADGSLTGQFGPERPVSVAELIVIAQRASNHLTDSSLTPENPAAQDQWFASSYATAERDGWFITFDPDADPTRTATRAEVVMTLLQALDVRLYWPHGDLFDDVHPWTANAASIETMARLGAIGSQREDGRLPSFRPNDNVNRAELSKMLILLLDTLELEAAKAGA